MMIRLGSFLALAGATVVACSAPGGGGRQAAPDTASATASSRPAPETSRPVSSAVPVAATGADSAADVLRQRADRARILGDSAARVWMVEVSDFQCPFCARFHRETFGEIRRAYISTGKVKLAYVNHPLPNHQHAWPAAEAALCAGAQGKFWEMHDALFNTQTAWSERATAESLFDSLAVNVGVAAPAYRQCMRDHVMRGLVQQDLDRSIQSGVGSTPTFFVGDTTILGAYPTPVFRRVLDSAVARAARGARSP